MSDEEIKELEKELLNLQIDFHRRASVISRRLQNIRRRFNTQSEILNSSNEDNFEDAQQEEQFEIDDCRIKIGDWVKITNDYRYSEKGIIGEVIKFNKSGDRLWIRDNNGITYQRAPWNVVKTTKPISKRRK